MGSAFQMSRRQIIIEHDPRLQPISGWLQHGAESRQEFQWMVELISLLDAARERASREAGPPPRGGQSAGRGPPSMG